MGVYIEDLTLPKDVTHVYMTMFRKDDKEPLTGCIPIELVTEIDGFKCEEKENGECPFYAPSCG